MPTPLTASAFDATTDLPDWRYLLGAIEATFRAPTFAAAAEFVTQVADAADAAQHHPDVHLRYPGVVRIMLTTHASGTITDLDVESARAISAMAGDAGLVSEPLAAERLEIAIDALDPDRIRPFWAAVLGYVDGPAKPDGRITEVVDPQRVGPTFWFQQMDEPRPQRNRFHVDVSVSHDVAEARVAAALAAGGVLLSDRWARAFWVLADAEGNEACVCTWQDRD